MIELNQIVHADCMDVMKDIPDKYFELAIVDPPYGIGMSNSNKRTKPSRPNSYTQYADFRYHETNWDNARPDKKYFEQLFRVSKQQIICGANYFCEYLPNGYGWIFWNKLNGLDNFFSDGEFIFASKGIQSKYFECSAFSNLSGGKARIHPTQKPVALYRWLLQNYAKPGDKIIDTHSGSGSCAIACFLENHNFLAIEKDADYHAASVKRLEEIRAQGRLF